uniref:Uncharacterized protein n=1 Tax=Oryza rufipogon TaxID=4529 RepID=A0A0E0QT89_ORYRU
MACLALWQLWRAAPAVCLDAAMAYEFYKLSVMASDLRRRGFSPDLLIRLKFVWWEMKGLKKYAKYCIPLLFKGFDFETSEEYTA